MKNVARLKENGFVGIDLAGSKENPTGWAFLRNKEVTTAQIYTDEEILQKTVKMRPSLTAIDAPLTLPKKGAMRKSDSEMHSRGYPVFPPLFPAMKKLTLRAIALTNKFRDEKVSVIEVHPTSARKALGMPTKKWDQIQRILLEAGFTGDLEEKKLTRHEIDATTAAITASLHVKRKTESIGDEEEGYMVVPVKETWKTALL